MGKTKENKESTDSGAITAIPVPGAGDNGDGDGEHDDSRNASRVKFESRLGRDEAVAYFEAIVAGLRKGSLRFQHADADLTLSPPQQVDVEVKAQRKGDRERVTFELSWRTTETAGLKIS